MQVYLTFFLWVILLIGTDYWEATPDVCSFLEQSCMHSCNPILLLFFITCVLFSLVEKVSEWGLQKTELNRPWSIFSMAVLHRDWWRGQHDVLEGQMPAWAEYPRNRLLLCCLHWSQKRPFPSFFIDDEISTISCSFVQIGRKKTRNETTVLLLKP